MSSVGATIKRLRLERGLTVTELARRAGLSQGYVSQIEGGRAEPSVRAVALAARALGVPLSDLLVGPDRDLMETTVVPKAAANRDAGLDDERIIALLGSLNVRQKQAILLIIAGILEAQSAGPGPKA